MKTAALAGGGPAEASPQTKVRPTVWVVKCGNMTRRIFDSGRELAEAAAAVAAERIVSACAERGLARVVASTGVSQLEFLEKLTALPGVPWAQVELFHLDEYIGLPGSHPASFQRFIRERIVQPTGIVRTHLIDGMKDARETCAMLGAEVGAAPIDLVIVGMGENGHLAFNDPPADFETEEPFLIVELDQRCREQQVGEGWFASFEDVPRQAISMSVRQILKGRAILAVVPEQRKAEAVKKCLEGEISPMAPASALRLHSNVTLMLDRDSASLLG